MKEPYASIRRLPARSFPWFTEEKQKTLTGLITEWAKRPADAPDGHTTALEIGSWCGDSARFFGRRFTRVYCVDTWAGPVDTHRFMLANLYQQFLSNIIAAELTDAVVPVRMSSTEAAIALDVKADLIYLDGNHNAEAAYLDFIAWWPHRADGGVFCGDDWSWHTVKDGVMQAAKDIGVKLADDGETWWVKS